MAKKATITKELDRRIHVLVSRQTDFGKTKLEFSLDELLDDKADVTARMEAICEEIEEMADKRIAVYEGDPGEEVEQPLEDEVEQESEPEPEKEPEQEEIELTEESINDMDKKELVELCETTEGLEGIDTGSKIKVLRVLIIDALFDEEEENEEESGADADTDNDSGDDAGGDGGDWQDEDWAD